MAGSVGGEDPHMQQARLAGSPVHRWRYGCAPAAAATAPAAVNTVAGAPPAAQVESNGARPEAVQAPARGSGTAAADGAVQAGEAEQATRPKPVPPPRSGDQRKAALDAARQRNAELKALRARLRTGELTLGELLDQAAQGDQAAGRMPARTALMALPGVRSAIASQLMIQAGIAGGCRAGALSARQREQLVGAIAAVRTAGRLSRPARHDFGH